MNALSKFFGVVTRGQTYLNALYLFLAFPLGLFYFVFFVTGFALGFPLIIVWIGILILLLVFTMWYALLAFERQLAISLLREEIPPMSRNDMTGKSLWEQFKSAITNPVTWKGLVYLFARFPLGIISFVVLVTLTSVSLALMATPFYYNLVPVEMGLLYFDLGGTAQPMWVIDTMGEAITVSLIGILLGLASLHLFNGMAWVSGKFARVMLGNFSSAPAAPVPPAPVQVEPVAETAKPAPEELPGAVENLESKAV